MAHADLSRDAASTELAAHGVCELRALPAIELRACGVLVRRSVGDTKVAALPDAIGLLTQLEELCGPPPSLRCAPALARG